ncbi:LOW QUALITY PROTEIN: hypothetical protein FGSG_13884 [Fusarium graminearum PH-1]|uniref:hypothetical protein n=1 Tax=Gibberella zeae (strain ATCC MYA-4620 / CBS 123657 / FGSC 9075 / NRRL 31084 / PH-1) TaxID=229533 RepID=UPI00021F225B|nr:LOW QUALITY PROTEIN: hypothetical protein FGSG_13884 [Fusarium graminearum PH-1]ESU17802.1 LOW QUALITY PROTEIN: hypothetical protein FGSG_13884 [Fusarium graminearum PH-1]|eukprot:XP_011325424.1 LOW QUALITY PROTEIN: hypothetical protein FGSG_13884 [Fusarium graminearum PH-1]
MSCYVPVSIELCASAFSIELRASVIEFQRVTKSGSYNLHMVSPGDLVMQETRPRCWLQIVGVNKTAQRDCLNTVVFDNALDIGCIVDYGGHDWYSDGRTK